MGGQGIMHSIETQYILLSLWLTECISQDLPLAAATASSTAFGQVDFPHLRCTTVLVTDKNVLEFQKKWYLQRGLYVIKLTAA